MFFDVAVKIPSTHSRLSRSQTAARSDEDFLRRERSLSLQLFLFLVLNTYLLVLFHPSQRPSRTRKVAFHREFSGTLRDTKQYLYRSSLATQEAALRAKQEEVANAEQLNNATERGLQAWEERLSQQQAAADKRVESVICFRFSSLCSCTQQIISCFADSRAGGRVEETRSCYCCCCCFFIADRRSR